MFRTKMSLGRLGLGVILVGVVAACSAAQTTPTRETGSTESALDGPHLTYYGGPIVKNARVVAVFWNAKVVSMDKLPAFYSWLVTSPFLAWQSEYDSTSPAQAIGSGTFVKAVTDTKAPTAVKLADADVQKELLRMIDAGEVPAPDTNTLYLVHFPPGVSITFSGAESCVQFCGYHSAVTHAGKNIYYGVVPDQGGACLGGCGDDPDPFNNLTAQSSHEFVELVTDPEGPLAPGGGTAAPRAWYDVLNGENADICNGLQAKVGPYVVQKAWSNKFASCIAVTP
jgi:hypothetical protein